MSTHTTVGNNARRGTGPTHLVRARSTVIRIVIADAHELVRRGLIALLATRVDVRVIGETANSIDTLQLVSELSPDVLLLDIGVDDDVPAAARIRTLRRLCPQTQVVVLTTQPDEILHETLQTAGASACITTAASLDDLSAAIGAAHSRVAGSRTERPRELLSVREREVLRLLALGRSNRAVAAELTIAEGTVKRHTNSIYRKLQVGSRIEAVNKALLIGVIPRIGR